MDSRAIVSGTFILLLSVASTGRSTPEPTQTRAEPSGGRIHCDPTSGLCFRVDDARESCGARRWVGRSEAGLCPDGAGGLQGRWALGAERGASSQAPYCSYQWRGAAAPDADALAALSRHDGLDSLEPDCPVVAVSSRTVDVTWPVLEAAFYDQTERLAILPAGQQPAAPVRVEIIDSAVTRRAEDGEPSHGRLGHGRAMGLIVRKLACPAPGDSCRAEVASTLALPLVDTPDGVVRDAVNGGYYGSLFDLASAIEEAVDEWQKTSPTHRLIVNLSLGWEPIHGGDFTSSPEELPAPVRAVWDAIARARCLGAAVVVAAGNRVEGPDAPTGPLYPAGWARRSVVAPAVCASLGVTETPESYSSLEPLVFAVGGVESNDADLGLARANARPELVAPAAHAVVEDTEQTHSVLQTGTSVAAAVTSAAAAVVWSYRPELTPAEVMELLYIGGADLGRSAEVCLGDVCDRTSHRVSVCGALQEACGTSLSGCPLSGVACQRKPGGRVARPSELPLEASSPVSAASVVSQTPVGWPCFGQLYSASSEVANPCPASQMYGAPALAAVGPQPNKGPACPHCVYSHAEQKLFIEIDPEAPGELTAPVLTVIVDSTLPDVRYFDLSAQVPLLNPGDEATVTDLDIGASSFESATIEFVVNGVHADLSPVLPL